MRAPNFYCQRADAARIFDDASRVVEGALAELAAMRASEPILDESSDLDEYDDGDLPAPGIAKRLNEDH